MKRQLTVTAFVRNFADYINRVAYRRERFTLTRGNRIIAEIRPVPEARTLSELPQILSELPGLSVEEAESFARDLEQARHELAARTEGDRWGS